MLPCERSCRSLSRKDVGMGADGESKTASSCDGQVGGPMIGSAAQTAKRRAWRGGSHDKATNMLSAAR